jgi:hypothetical protein
MIVTFCCRPLTQSFLKAEKAQNEANQHIASSSASTPVSDFLTTAIALLQDAQSAWAKAKSNGTGSARVLQLSRRICEAQLNAVRWLQESLGQSRAAIDARYPGLVDSWMTNWADVDVRYMRYPTGEPPAPHLPNLLRTVPQCGRIGEITLRLLELQLTPDGKIRPAQTQH